VFDVVFTECSFSPNRSRLSVSSVSNNSPLFTPVPPSPPIVLSRDSFSQRKAWVVSLSLGRSNESRDEFVLRKLPYGESATGFCRGLKIRGAERPRSR